MLRLRTALVPDSADDWIIHFQDGLNTEKIHYFCLGTEDKRDAFHFLILNEV